MGKAHVFVATPMYGGMCTGFFTQSLLTMSKVMSDNDIDMTFQAMFNESLIQRGRNALAHNFMKNKDLTHLLFIDADIRFNPQDIIAMIDADKDIICGIYPKKEINWNGVAHAAKTDVPVEHWKHYTGSLVVNLVGYDGAITVPIDQPVEIWNGGTGFMLIKRSALEHMKDELPSYVNDVQIIGEQIVDRITEFSACAIEPETNRLLSEDY
jgi:hypothetical protein